MQFRPTGCWQEPQPIVVVAQWHNRFLVSMKLEIRFKSTHTQRNDCAGPRMPHHLELTEQGRAMHARIMPLAVHMYEKVFACLSDRETQTLRSVLTKLLASVHALEGTGQ